MCACDGGRGEEKRRSGWVRRKARMRGERSRKSGGREQGKERGREGERRKEEREGEREGRAWLRALSLPLPPALCRCRAASAARAARSAPTDRRQEVPAREGAREGLSGTGGRKEGGVCPSGLTGSGYYQRQVRMQIASCLWGTGCRGGRLQSSRRCQGFWWRGEAQLSRKRHGGRTGEETR